MVAEHSTILFSRNRLYHYQRTRPLTAREKRFRRVVPIAREPRDEIRVERIRTVNHPRVVIRDYCPRDTVERETREGGRAVQQSDSSIQRKELIQWLDCILRECRVSLHTSPVLRITR